MTAVIDIAAPPQVPRTEASGVLILLLPVVMSVATLAVLVAGVAAGSPMARNPTVLAVPAMMLVSLAVTALNGRGRRRGSTLDADRDEYLAYLSGLQGDLTELATSQQSSLRQAHPAPDSLWTLVGSPQMWQRRPDDPDFCRVRVGVGPQPLATGLVVAPTPSERRCDPVTTTALRRLLRTYSTVTAPIAIVLSAAETVTIDGEVSRVRALLRAMICQLAATHAPEHLSIVAAVGDAGPWAWFKWLPHNPGRVVYPTSAAARNSLARVPARRAVLIVDGIPGAESVWAGATILRVGRHDSSLLIRRSATQELLTSPDRLTVEEAVVCARRLAAYTGTWMPRGASDWAGLLGIGDVTTFDPITLWRKEGRRLRVPIGATSAGRPVHLDINEAAQQGMGPHGLCVGATGSGKSELLRTVALGMIAANPPDVLNLLLIDFKGGATFLGLADAPHVAAVITNLADEAPLVTRMRDALAGEMNRRQQLLRSAGNFVSVAAYQQGRGTAMAPLPTLFIIVDEFAELLTQHPDFADTFVAIGRLGRSLGMHLLLASQRFDEGRLRGLEAHLSYRVCLKTLSPGESRAVLATTDAYELPNAPGAGFLRVANGELIRFQTAFVSGPAPATRVTLPAQVRRFTATALEAVADPDVARNPSVLRVILDRLAGHGPPAHQVWLPPLGAAPTLGALLPLGTPAELAVPIGIVDRPYEQCRTPLTVDLSGAAGNVAVVGAPQSGKSSALRTLTIALAATHDSAHVQFYCLDFGGGSLSSVGGLPHVGAVADRSQPELVWRMVAEVRSALRHREASFREHGAHDAFADLFLVVDGWAAVCHEFEAIEESITAIAAQGLSYGVHVVLSASRWAEIRPALKDQIGTRLELRLGDPADSEIDRRQARQVPRGQPGRGLSREGLHMIIALPDLDGLELRYGASAAPPIPLLPAEVDYTTMVAGDAVLLGLEEHQLKPATLDFGQHPHLLILGHNGCGKTAALRTLCYEVVRTNAAAQARLFVVDFRRCLLDVVEPEYLGGYAMSPAALSVMLPGLVALLRQRMPPADISYTQLRARSWWTGPEVYLVVDDYDLVATPSGNPLAMLVEYLPYATDLGLHVIVARRSGGAARALFEPLLASLRDLGCMGLLMSGHADDGVLLGSRPAAPLPPGRGILSTRPGDERLVQVAWSPPP